MLITPYECPSQGLDNDSESINIEGLGFQDLIKYSREYESARTELEKYLVDYNWIKKLVKNWKKINLADLDYIILLWKKSMVSDEKEFTVQKKCPHCGKINELNLNLDQLYVAVPIDYYLGGTIKLGVTQDSYDFKVPCLDYFDKVVAKVTRLNKSIDVDLVKLISLFPDYKNRPTEIQQLVLNAKYDDIQVLELLKSIYLNSKINLKYYCTYCKGGDWSMRVNSLIDNPFLSLVLSSGSIESKISIKQVRRDGQS